MKKLSADVSQACELLDRCFANSGDPEVLAMFQKLGLPLASIELHKHRLARVANSQRLAKQLTQNRTALEAARDKLTALETQSTLLTNQIESLSTQLADAKKSNDFTKLNELTKTLSPQLAKAQNSLESLKPEFDAAQEAFTLAKSNFAASEIAFESLAMVELMPLAVQVAVGVSAAQTDDDLELAKIDTLLNFGNAALKTEARDYDVRGGDFAPVGAINKFYESGGVPGNWVAPLCFDESGTRLHGDGLFKPFPETIFNMLAEVRLNVARLEQRRAELLGAVERVAAENRTLLESVYVAPLRSELMV